MQVKVNKIPWYLSWKGLLGTKEPKTIVFRTCFGIHTFGMQYPIDVVILNKKGIVVKSKENLAPNRFYFWNPLHITVIELPNGTIRKRKISMGNHIELENA